MAAQTSTIKANRAQGLRIDRRGPMAKGLGKGREMAPKGPPAPPNEAPGRLNIGSINHCLGK